MITRWDWAVTAGALGLRLLLGVIAYNLGNLLRRFALPRAIQSWSLTSLQQRLFKPAGASSDMPGTSSCSWPKAI